MAINGVSSGTANGVETASRPLSGKLAIVTGASRGIGAAIVENLASKGCSIVGTYAQPTSKKGIESLFKRLAEKYGTQYLTIQADLNHPETAAKTMIDAVKHHFASPSGQLTIHILVNNAGVGGDYRLEDVPVAEFNRMYTVNVLGPLLTTQAVIPHLPHDRSGRIVNLSSVAASMGFETHTLYGGTKAALDAMTRTWARELAERATVNAINPGPVEGDMFYAAGENFWKQLEPFQLKCPLAAIRDDVDQSELVKLSHEKMGGRRPAYWTEVAGIVGMLCSEESSWCTGSVVCANGGFRFST